MIKPASYGWKPDLPDQRDWVFSSIRKVKDSLSSIDLRTGCSKIEDQSSLGSCTANAIVSALEFLMIKNKVKFEDLSRLFVYYNERALSGTTGSDSGASLRDGMRAINQWGVCNENNWPYMISKFSYRPPLVCYNEAKKHKVLSYYRLNTLSDMRLCLTEGFPFVFGFSVYENFITKNVALSGKVSMPNKKERILGGHAVTAVGFRDSDNCFIVRNSWGTKWGDKGYFYMPYDYLVDRNLSDDFWTIRKGLNL